MKFTPFPVIESKRLCLRKIMESDSEAIFFLRSVETVSKYIKYIERPEDKITKNLSDAIKWVKRVDECIEKNECIIWGITFKNDPRIIGIFGMGNFSNNNKTAEVGFELDPKFHSKGIMSETLKKIIDFGFIELKLDKIEAITHPENVSSIKLLDRNGFSLNENRKDPDYKSTIFYELEKASS